MENPQPSIEAQLHRCPLFAEWPADRLRELAATARRQRYRSRTPLATRERPLRDIFVVESGAIEVIAANAAGDEHRLMIQEARVAGLVPFYELETRWIYGFYARKGSTIIHLHGDTLRHILDDEPLLWRSVALFALRRLHRLLELLQSLTIGSVRRRLAVHLTMLALPVGAEEPGARSTELHSSQTDLAHALGVARQTVSKELVRLKKEGVISGESGYGCITVLELPRLLRIAREP